MLFFDFERRVPSLGLRVQALGICRVQAFGFVVSEPEFQLDVDGQGKAISG